MKKITLLVTLLSISLGFAQDPATGPTNPEARDAIDVVSFYNGIETPVAPQYTNETGIIFDVFGSPVVISDLELADGNTVKKYVNHNFSGIGGGSYNVSQMQTLHIDVYFATAPGDFRIKLEDQTGGAGATEISVAANAATGVWIPYEIDLANFAAPNLTSLKWIVPVTTSTNASIYFDNIYFYRTPVNPATDATLSDLTVGGMTVPGFSPGTTTYNVELPRGTAVAPMVAATTNNGMATTNITQAPGVPGDAIVVVTASDMSTTQNYTVMFSESGPATAAPVPPVRDAENVLSIYSDAYTDVPVDNFDFGLCPNIPAVSEEMIGGDSFQRYTGPGCQGIGLETNRLDASEFTNFHFDFYTDDAVIGAVFNIKLVDWNGNATEAGSTGLEINLNGGTNPALVEGSWVSVDVDITALSAPMVIGNLTRSDIAQIHITSNLPSAWYDNIYFYKETFEPGTCSDGIMNQDETGIDCGGTISGCAPCTGPPSLAAPTPPNRATEDVISIYSDAYTDITVDAFDFGLCDGNLPNQAVSEVMIAGNLTQNYLKPGCQGIDFQNNRQDASAFTNIHIDVYADAVPDGAVFNLKLVDWAGNLTEAGSTGLEIIMNAGTTPKLVANEWISLDVDITALGGSVLGVLERGDVAQFHITSNLPNAWYDNLYLYKGVPLSTNDFNNVEFKAYPNPTQDSWTIKNDSSVITSIQVFDVLGKSVLSLSPNTSEANVNGSTLKSGLYFAQVKTATGISSLKLIKK